MRSRCHVAYVHFAQLARVFEDMAELRLEESGLFLREIEASELGDVSDVEIGGLGHLSRCLEMEIGHEPDHRGREGNHENKENDAAFATFFTHGHARA